MSTIALTVVVDKNIDASKEICVLYRRLGGYPCVHGAELKELLKGMQIGIDSEVNPPPKFAWSMNCMAGQLVAHFKRNPQDRVALYPATVRNIGETYIYTVAGECGQPLHLKVEWLLHRKVLFEGLLDNFDPDIHGPPGRWD